MKKFIFVLFPLLIICINCVLVVRSPHTMVEVPDQKMPFQYQADIFTDALWLTPPVYGKKLEFVDGRVKVPFAGQELVFAKQPNGDITMTQADSSLTASGVQAHGDHYFNLEIIPWKTVYREKYVSKTEWVTEQVTVRKTRPKTESVYVQKSRTVYDPITKSSRTEYYSDWELRTTTEWYDDTESRQVLKTVWYWDRVPVQVLDIPDYTIFRFTCKNGGQVLIYSVATTNGLNYYFQNVGYCAAVQKLPGPFGQDVPVRLLLIDTDQNGIYGDPEDQILFNTWNPYDQKSSYQEISNYMDNQWLRLAWLAEETFLTVAVDEKSGEISWKNANTPFLKTETSGKIEITGLPRTATISINGAPYDIDDGVVSYSIEYGYFKAVIQQPGHFDQVFRFAITEKTPEFNARFTEQPAAATVTVTNHAFRNWKLMAQDENGKEWVVFNTDNISVPGGKYRIIISGGGTSFVKEATLAVGEQWVYNFTADTLTLQPPAPVQPDR